MTSPPLSDQLRQFFFMSRPIAEADQRVTSEGDIGVRNMRAARLLLGAAETFDNEADRQLAALAILRDAALVAAQGVALRRKLEITDSEPLTSWKSVLEQADMPAAPSPEIREQLTKFVATGVTAEYGEWPVAELSALRQTLLTVVRRLVVDLEQDVFAPKRLRWQRFSRWAMTFCGILLVVGFGVKRVKHSLRPRPSNNGSTNVALNRSVRISSNWRADVFSPDHLVDGDATHIGCHSESQLNPWAVIDLASEYIIHRVVVTNRLDGAMENAVPLRIEWSLDGKKYVEYARRNETFAVWTAEGTPVEARYVRLTVMKPSLLHLNEVEVY